jgi:hypothetical protein
MDADAMITIAFCFEVFLFALAAGLFGAHEVRKGASRATAEIRTEPRPVALTAHQIYERGVTTKWH